MSYILGGEAAVTTNQANLSHKISTMMTTFDFDQAIQVAFESANAAKEKATLKKSTVDKYNFPIYTGNPLIQLSKDHLTLHPDIRQLLEILSEAQKVKDETAQKILTFIDMTKIKDEVAEGKAGKNPKNWVPSYICLIMQLFMRYNPSVSSRDVVSIMRSSIEWIQTAEGKVAKEKMATAMRQCTEIATALGRFAGLSEVPYFTYLTAGDSSKLVMKDTADSGSEKSYPVEDIKGRIMKAVALLQTKIDEFQSSTQQIEYMIGKSEYINEYVKKVMTALKNHIAVQLNDDGKIEPNLRAYFGYSAEDFIAKLYEDSAALDSTISKANIEYMKLCREHTEKKKRQRTS